MLLSCILIQSNWSSCVYYEASVDFLRCVLWRKQFFRIESRYVSGIDGIKSQSIGTTYFSLILQTFLFQLCFAALILQGINFHGTTCFRLISSLPQNLKTTPLQVFVFRRIPCKRNQQISINLHINQSKVFFVKGQWFFLLC